MYTRSDDDILPAARRRGGRRARSRPGPRAARLPTGRRAGPVPAPHVAPVAEVPGVFESPRPATAPAPPAATPAARAGVGRAGRRTAAVLGEIALTVAAVLGLAMAGVTVVAARTGVRPLVVRSGSMEPTIPTGSMVLVQRVAAAEIAVGDVVAVERPDHTRVTHRVVGLERRGETAELTLKGDANEDADPAPVSVVEADRLIRQVPEVGRFAAWLATAPGGFVIGCLLTAVTMLALRRRPDDG